MEDDKKLDRETVGWETMPAENHVWNTTHMERVIYNSVGVGH